MIYDKVKEQCKKNGISVNTLEKELGIAKGSLCKIDNHKPSAEKIKKIADRLGCSSEYLLGESEQEIVDAFGSIDIKKLHLPKGMKTHQVVGKGMGIAGIGKMGNTSIQHRAIPSRIGNNFEEDDYYEEDDDYYEEDGEIVKCSYNNSEGNEKLKKNIQNSLTPDFYLSDFDLFGEKIYATKRTIEDANNTPRIKKYVDTLSKLFNLSKNESETIVNFMSLPQEKRELILTMIKNLTDM